MPKTLKLVATCAFGLEGVVSRELKQLGFAEIHADNASVSFEADELGLCRANLWLRSADRVFVRLASFTATTFEELFQGVKRIPWAELLPRDACFPVEGASHESTLSSVPACQGIVKKAIVESLKARYGQEWFEETGATYKVRMVLVRNQVTISLDSSGWGLHKRGYRRLTAAAPLRETLAAGLVQLSVYGAQRVLADPFCGSGTIPIEAAYLALRRAPGLTRSFAAEQWAFVGSRAWATARQEAEDLFDRTTRLTIFGSDADGEVLSMARYHLKQAGLEDRGVYFQTLRVEDFRSQKKHGIIITNPPYGERLGDQQEAERLYRELGRVVKPLDTWSVYTITAHPTFERLLGQSLTRKRKMYNGMLACTYYSFVGPPPPRPRPAGEAVPPPG